MDRNEAIKVIKDNWPEGRVLLKLALEFLIPELKESEDGRMLREIKRYIKEQGDKPTGLPNGTIAVADMLAWLEKQDKKIDAIENFDTEFEKQVSHLIASAINKEHEYNEGFVKWTANALLNYAKHELEKQNQKKHEEELENAYKCADEVQYRKGYEDAKREFKKQDKIKRSNYPYVPGWRENRPDNKPKIKNSILMLTTHGVAEGEWLGEEWCQYRWSCKVKDEDVLYWLHLSDLETLEKENANQDFSWLEKQGEQKSQCKSVLEVWKDMRFKVYQQASGNRNEANHSDDSTKMFSLTNIDEIFEKITEKQDKQKSTDKVKPKFKVGDWIVQEGIGTYKVVEVYKWYEVIGIDGNQYSISFLQENDCHLWTIQDAKNGDILTDKQNCTCIFREIMTDEGETSVDAYCGITIDNEFVVNEKGEIWTVPEDLFPATKEQCTLLFQKMQETGYEWSDKDRKLTKIVK